MCPHTSNALHPSINCTSSILCSPFTQDVPPATQCTPFTLSWNLVDFNKEREENVVLAMSIVPFSFWVEFSPVFGGFKNKNVKKVGFFGSLFYIRFCKRI